MAPYAFRVTRVTLSGTAFGGAESWSTGFFLGNPSADADLPSQSLADSIRDAWITYFTTASNYIASQYKFTEVKVSSFGTDGLSNPLDTVYSVPSGNVVGTNAGTVPPQCSIVATLQAVVSRGLASKGRMYLPGIGIGVTSTGKITSTQAQGMANNLKTFFDTINALPTADEIINASHGQLTAAGAPKPGGAGPVNRKITSVKVGDVYDTQRRRRDALVEAYSSASLA